MPNIIQIEELVYGRMRHINQSDWMEMLSAQGVSASLAILLDDYWLLEQTDYRFNEGKYISSERFVYNTDWSTYHSNHNAIAPDNTEEIVTVRYDLQSDRYFVYYTHFPIQKEIILSSDILAEADIPSSTPDHQAPPESKVSQSNSRPVSVLNNQPKQALRPAPKQLNPLHPKQPITVIKPSGGIDTLFSSAKSTPVKKKWRRINELKQAYDSGKTLEQIVAQFDCTKEGAIYQLKTYLGIKHPFEQQLNRHLDRRKWTSQELTQLISLSASNTSYATIARRLNRDLDDVMDKMQRYGLID